MHGYWLGLKRVGFVARPVGLMKGDPYHWEVAPITTGTTTPVYNNPDAVARGKCETLREAKRMVEKKYREALLACVPTPTTSPAPTARGTRRTSA